MNPLVSHLVSGRILLTGLGFVVLLVIGLEWTTRSAGRRLLVMATWFAAALALSTAAVTWYCVGGLAGCLLLWNYSLRFEAKDTRQRLAADALILYCLGVMVHEMQWYRTAFASPVISRRVLVLGDSLSAGMGEGEGVPWPRQLEELAAIPVMNLSQAGATSQDGAAMARLALQFPGLVVVELGGNDLLGSRSVAQYESDMARTLQVLVEHQRGIAIVELPLIPGKNAWGVAQRRLAQQFGCQLIPKRHLVDVLAAPGATVDTLHLSHQGHRYMAVMIWKQIRERMPADEADVVAPAERSHSE